MLESVKLVGDENGLDCFTGGCELIVIKFSPPPTKGGEVLRQNRLETEVNNTTFDWIEPFSHLNLPANYILKTRYSFNYVFPMPRARWAPALIKQVTKSHTAQSPKQKSYHRITYYRQHMGLRGAEAK